MVHRRMKMMFRQHRWGLAMMDDVDLNCCVGSPLRRFLVCRLVKHQNGRLPPDYVESLMLFVWIVFLRSSKCLHVYGFLSSEDWCAQSSLRISLCGIWKYQGDGCHVSLIL